MYTHIYIHTHTFLMDISSASPSFLRDILVLKLICSFVSLFAYQPHQRWQHSIRNSTYLYIQRQEYSVFWSVGSPDWAVLKSACHEAEFSQSLLLVLHCHSLLIAEGV